MIQKLSVVIITYNEEENIGLCIDAASAVADEIIVVDSFSTDRTKQICLDKGVKFDEHKFEGHIQQKNYAITLAQHNHILSLDADEILSEELTNSIIDVKANWKADAYSLSRRSYYCGKFINHGDWYPDRKIRLFKKEAGKWAGLNPHDTFVLDTNKILRALKGDLYHYTYNTVEEHIAQANKFSSIGAQELINRNVHVSVFTLILHPLWRFFRSYFLRFGFLDGLRGYSIAQIIAVETYLKYLKVVWPVNKFPFNDYRVLQISSIKGWRGGEQQVAYLATELRKAGKESYFFIAKNSELEEFCKVNNFQYTTVRFGNGFNLFAAFKLKKICIRYQIDLVHMHCSSSHMLSIFSNLLGNKPKLVLSRRVDFSIGENTLSRKKYNYEAIEKILCVSDKINEVIRPAIQNKSIIHTVYSGIDLDKFHKADEGILRKEYGISSDTLLIGNVAAIANHKDYFTFVETVDILVKQGLNALYLIIGNDAGEETAIRALIEEKQLGDKIILTGFRTDIIRILPELDVFLFTSKEEGLGTSLLDAMASEVPIVATKAGGVPEIVINNFNGLLCDIQDPTDLAQSVLRITEDEQLRTSLVQNAKSTVLNFSKEKMATETKKHYDQVIE